MKDSRRRFEPAEYAARQAKTRLAMEKQGLDLLIVSDPSNMCWLTGFDGWSFYVHQCVVIGSQGELFRFGRGIDAPTAYLTTDLAQSEVITYPDHYVQSPEIHPMEYMAGICKQRRVLTGKIGVETDITISSAVRWSLNTLSTDCHSWMPRALVNCNVPLISEEIMYAGAGS